MKNTFLKAIVACVAVLSAAGPVAAQPRPDRVCLRQIDMYSFDSVPGNRSLIVEDRGHQRYRINFVGICSGLQFKLGLRFKTFSTSNLSCLSRGDQVLQRDPVVRTPCIIKDIQRQTMDMDRADLAAKSQH
ncbi:MAG: hypothetical protein JWP16_2196 [Alphaproteobacteria bacterium]|jgi:hypothetical protein|nr:hypothetical protein [Alphaproteobacteria bacterium]MDB5741156.1 hypothetical protein [Alphaproteobacteria bacterium]